MYEQINVHEQVALIVLENKRTKLTHHRFILWVLQYLRKGFSIETARLVKVVVLF